MRAFLQFALLPGELRDMVWDEAATAPMVHFMVPVISQSDWFDGEATLVPDKQSGALGLVYLSLTCRDARAAVTRRNKNIINKTIFRTLPSQGYKRINLVLDLNIDLVCLANPMDWTEWEHVILWSARRLAIRYDPRWDVLSGVLAQQATISGMGGVGGCIHTALPGTRPPTRSGDAGPSGLFRIRCIANGWDQVPKFYAYNGTCFEVRDSSAHAMSGIEPAIALESIREYLVSGYDFSLNGLDQLTKVWTPVLSHERLKGTELPAKLEIFETTY